MAKLAGYGTLALLALILGYSGLAVYLRGHPEFPSDFWDVMYYDLQLFVLGSEPIKNGGRLPFSLQVARFAAPSVTAYAIISAIASLLDDQRRELLIRKSRDHTIVCGGGVKGTLIAARLREHGTKVVIIDNAPSADLVNSCKEHGIMLLDGDASTVGTLHHAAVRRASVLYAVTPENVTNTAIVILAHRLTLSRARPLCCYASIEDRVLRAALMARYLGSPARAGLELDLFSTAEIGVHVLLNTLTPISAAKGSARTTIIGLDDFGQTLVIELARRWRGRFQLTGKRLELVLMDGNAHRSWEQLTTQYQFLDEVCQTTLIPTDPEFQPATPYDLPLELSLVPSPDASFVSIDDHDKALAIGLAMVRFGGGNGTRVTVRVDTHGSELHEAFHDVSYRLFDDMRSSLHIFAALEAACEPSVIREGIVIETIARSLHDGYVATCLAQGDSPATNDALRPWEELDETFRESNRRQVRHIGQKLSSIGCLLVPHFDDGRSFSYRTSPDEVEQLARAEHIRWMSERLELGYEFGIRRQEMSHPDLVDWNQLSESARDKDRAFIRALPDTLANAGFQIVRLSDQNIERT